MRLMVFGVQQMNPGIGAMKAADLLLKRDKLIALLGIAGDGDAGNRGLDAPLRFDGGCDDGIVTEDLLNLVRIGRFAPNADACGQVMGKAGAAKTEGIGRLRHQGRDRNPVDVGFRKPKHEAKAAERLFDSEELKVVAVDCGKLVGSSLQAEREDIDLRSLDVLREVRIGAFDGHAGFSSGHDSGGLLDPVEDTVVDLLRDIIDGDRSTGIAETAAAMVAGSRRKQGAVGSEDVEAHKPELFDFACRAVGVDAVAECDAQRLRPDACEVMVLQADPSKAKTLLGWEAEMPLEEGLRQTADWLVRHRHLYRPGQY